MRPTSRYLIYLSIGFLIYYIIDSGKTSLTYEEVRKWLAIGIIISFILLLIVRIARQRRG